MTFIAITMTILVIVIVFGILFFFFNVVDTVKSPVNVSSPLAQDVVGKVGTGSHLFQQIVTNYWIYALTGGVVVALVLLIMTAIREEPS